MSRDDSSEKKLIQDQSQPFARKRTQFNNEQDNLTKVDSNMNCYESTLNCCGSFWGNLRVWCPCICFMCPYPFQMITQGQKGLLTKFGKFQRVLEPGFHEVNPCTENVARVSVKTKQLILTKDNITVDIDTILYYRLIDVVKANYRVKEVVTAIKEITYATLRQVCGEHSLQDMLENRQIIADEIENYVFETVAEWGVFVEQVFIKDMILSEPLQFSLSMAPKAQRMAQSKIIAAKADVEAAKLLREASDMLNSRAAMQIRYFETIQGIAKGPNPKILFLGLNQDEKKK